MKPLQRVAQTIGESDFKIFCANVSSGGKFQFPPTVIVNAAATETQPVRKVRASNEGLS